MAKKNGSIHPTRIFKKPEELIEAWNKFKKHLKEVETKNWPKIQYVGKDGERKEDYPVVPYTYEGFLRYCYENKIGVIHHYFDSKEDCYIEFRGVCRHVKQEIREQQIIGGMLNFYNPSITQRLNGLADKQDITKTSVQPIKIESATPEEEKLNEETLKDLEE